MSAPIDDRTGLEVLFRDECLPLLQESMVGRVAFTVGAQPMILPVNYVMDGDRAVFRTAPGTKLDAVRHARVAFEVDGYDVARRAGWSVLVQGRAEEVRDEVEVAELERLALRPWALGEKRHWIRVTPTVITGRRIPEVRLVDEPPVVVDWAVLS